MKTIIASKLMQYGVRPNLSGFTYMITAIEIILKNNCNKLSITKEIYSKAAEIYNTTASRVERAIRHAIGNLNNDSLKCCLNITHFTNSEFLYYVAYQLMAQDAVKELLNNE